TLFICSKGSIEGYTVGNDMSSRSIEGENPLYLPQAKVYDGACAIGPVIAINDGEQKPRSITMAISREGTVIFDGETSTGNIRRPLDELAEYLFREMTFPAGVFLFTGTGIVPPDEFTLMVGDVVTIAIEGIGILENTVA
ncbi:MAG: fumarylacetoacetate hydrolase family protein, partial [Acidobacteriota bacterium]